MQYIMLIIEQLHRAAFEVATDHPINNRIALILIDNAAELIVHHRLEYHLAHEKFGQKLSQKQRLMGRGQRLDERLKVLRHLNDFSEPEQLFIKAAHGYRNELYHAGLRHEDVIRAIAARYFDLVCDLFVRLPRGFRALSSLEELTETAIKYLNDDQMRTPDEVIAARLRAQLPANLPPLQATLSASARRAVEEIEWQLSFLVSDNPNRYGLDEILSMAQWQRDFEDALTEEGIEGTWRAPGYLEKVNDVHARMRATWKRRHGRVPLEEWKARADSIEGEADTLVAMARSQDLRRDMGYLAEAIERSAAGLDQYIQDEVDRIRGK
jgi:hypothetical protein